MINDDNTEFINVFKICWMEKITTPTFSSTPVGIRIYFNGAPSVIWYFATEEEQNIKWNTIVNSWATS